MLDPEFQVLSFTGESRNLGTPRRSLASAIIFCTTVNAFISIMATKHQSGEAKSVQNCSSNDFDTGSISSAALIEY